MPRYLMIFIAVISVTFTLYTRLSGLSERGVYYCDEASFMCNARFYGGLIEYGSRQALRGDLSRQGLIDEAQRLYEAGGTPSQHAKPLFYAALITAFVVFGESDATFLSISALSGVALVLLFVLYGLKQRRFDVLLGSLPLAWSMVHMHYSRCALSQALSMLVSTTLLLYLLHKKSSLHEKKTQITIGFLTGVAFLSHYNLFWVPFVVVGWVIFVSLRSDVRAKQLVGIICTVAIAAFCTLLIVELPYRVLMSYAMKSQSLHDKASLVFTTYFEQIIAQVTWGGFSTSEKVGFSYFPMILMKYEGSIWCGLILIGLSSLVLKLRNDSGEVLVLLLWIFVPYVVWSLQGFPAPRAYASIIPALCMAAGIAIAGLCNNAARRVSWNKSWLYPAIIACSVSIVTIARTIEAAPLLEARSPYARAAKEIKVLLQKAEWAPVYDGDLSVTMQPVWRWYLGGLVRRDPLTRKAFICDLGTLSRSSLRRKMHMARSFGTRIIKWDAHLDGAVLIEDAWMPYAINMYHEETTARYITLIGPKDAHSANGNDILMGGF